MDSTHGGRQPPRLEADANRWTPSTSRAATLPRYLDDADLEARRNGARHPRKNNPCSELTKPIIVRRAHAPLHHAHADNIYRMKTRPKGLFLMINNVSFKRHGTRFGAERDQDNLVNLFRKLGYRVECWRDEEELRAKFVRLSLRPELGRTASVFVAVGSHGTGNCHGGTDIVAGGEEDTLCECRWLVTQLDADNCRAMFNKPKVFLFQVCRGQLNDIADNPTRRHPTTQTDAGTASAPNRLNGDILEAYASVQGYCALRDMKLGSWFFQAVTKIYSQHACEDDIETMQKKVDSLIKQCTSNDKDTAKQTSTYSNLGFNKFYFYPGVYSD